jgi:hypothetical protein
MRSTSPIPVLLQRSLIHSDSARLPRTIIHSAFCKDLNEKILAPSLILDYRKMAQNAIYSGPFSEGVALNYCGSVLYDF